MKEKIIAALKALGIIPEADLPKIESELAKLELDKAPVIDASKVADAGLKSMLETIQSELVILRQSNKNLTDALANERTEREKAISAQQAASKAQQDAKVKTAVDDAIKAGKYPEAKREHLTKLFTNDFDSAAEIIKDSPVDKHFKPADGNNGKFKKKEEINNTMKSPLEVGSSMLTKVKELANVTD